MSQLKRVQKAMQDGEWHTLEALSKALGIGEACLSAHIRSLRKPKHGSWTVERSHHEDADRNKCFHYRLRLPVSKTVKPPRAIERLPEATRQDLAQMVAGFARDLAFAVVEKRLDEMRRVSLRMRP